MNQIFVDTGAWYAIADPGDANHQTALQCRNRLARKSTLITTNYVFDELYTLLLLNVGYQPTIAFKRKLDLLAQRHILEIVWISAGVADHAWEIFERFNADKQWSFTDCTSYIVMKQRHLSEVFAFDHHFTQMGFIRRP